MDITPSSEFCAACRIVLGGDTPDIVIRALRTELGHEIEQVHKDCRGAAGCGAAVGFAGGNA